MKEFDIYLAPPNLDKAEFDLLAQVIDSGWIAPIGPALQEFEKNLCEKFKFPYFLATNSGTSALHLSLKMAGIEEGDAVGVPTYTFGATANVVLYEKAMPVFFDSESKTVNVDPDLLDDYLSKKRLKAVIITHQNGMPAQMDELIAVCDKHGVLMIEDAAQALGSQFNHQYAGSWGKMAAFSFNGNKIITTGGGGGLVLENKSAYDRALNLSSQAQKKGKPYHYEFLGYNYRMSNVLAAIGIGQLQKLDRFLDRKRDIYKTYLRALKRFDCFEFFEEVPGIKGSWWLSSFMVRKEYLNHIDPEMIISHLASKGVQSRTLYRPLHDQALYGAFPFIGSDIAMDIYRRGFCLPSGTGLINDDQEKVIEVLSSLLFSRGLS